MYFVSMTLNLLISCVILKNEVLKKQFKVSVLKLYLLFFVEVFPLWNLADS